MLSQSFHSPYPRVAHQLLIVYHLLSMCCPSAVLILMILRSFHCPLSITSHPSADPYPYGIAAIHHHLSITLILSRISSIVHHPSVVHSRALVLLQSLCLSSYPSPILIHPPSLSLWPCHYPSSLMHHSCPFSWPFHCLSSICCPSPGLSSSESFLSSYPSPILILDIVSPLSIMLILMFSSSSHRPSFSHLSIALILVHNTSIVHPSVVHHLIHPPSLFKFLWPRHYPSCLSLCSRRHPIVHRLVHYPLLLSLFTILPLSIHLLSILWSIPHPYSSSYGLGVIHRHLCSYP